MAAGDGLVAVLGHDHLDTVDVVGVDNGGDVEVGGASEAVKADLTEHARGHLGALRDREPVAGPALREGLVDGGHAIDDEVVEGLETEVWGEDNGTLSAVLVDEVDNVVGGSQGRKRGGCEKDGTDELHFDNATLRFLL